MASIVITIENLPTNPVQAQGGSTLDKAAALGALENTFRALAAGETPVNSAGAPVVTVSSTTTLGSATVTFSGPLTSGTDTITIAGTALTAQKFNGTNTVTLATPIAGDTLTIGGVTYAFVTNTNLPADLKAYNNPLSNRNASGQIMIPLNVVDGTGTVAVPNLVAMTNTQLAAWIGSVMNNDPALNGIISTTASAAVVTMRANLPGATASLIPSTSSNSGRVGVAGGTFTGGLAVNNNQFDPGITAAQVAATFAAAVNASTTAAISGNVIAYLSSPTVVTLKNRSSGAGSTISLAKSAANAAVSTATLNVGTLSAGAVFSL